MPIVPDTIELTSSGHDRLRSENRLRYATDQVCGQLHYLLVDVGFPLAERAQRDVRAQRWFAIEVGSLMFPAPGESMAGTLDVLRNAAVELQTRVLAEVPSFEHVQFIRPPITTEMSSWLSAVTSRCVERASGGMMDGASTFSM